MRSRLFHAIVGVAVSVSAPSSIGCSDPARSDAVVDPPLADSVAGELGDDTAIALDDGSTDVVLDDTAMPRDSAPMTDSGADTRAAADTRPDADGAADSDAVADAADAVTDVPTDADADSGWHPTK